MVKRGLTFIELLVVVVLVVVVVGVVGLVLSKGLESWNIGSSEIALQRQAQEMMGQMIDGNDRIAGIREALEVIEATPTSFGFIPLWTDLYPHYTDESKEFVLTRNFKPGATVPIGQIRIPNTKRFVSVPTFFSYGEEKSYGSSEDTVEFINPIPSGSDVRILFYPDASVDETVVMRYYWDSEEKRVFRIYNGQTEDIIRHDKKVKIPEFEFRYYNNLNNEIKSGSSDDLVDYDIGGSSSANVNLSAIGINFDVEKVLVKRTISSFVSIRALGGNLGSALALDEGTEFKIPDSRNIRTLVLDNIGGIKQNSKLEIQISTGSGRASWRIKIDFGVVDDEPSISGFTVEYPKGTVVYTNKRTRSIRKGLNLLQLGNDYYDYDDDNNIDDIVNIEGDNVMLKVTKMDLGAAAIFVRP